MLNHYCLTWIEDWCNENGWTDVFTPNRNEFWAFPPHAVMPLPIPSKVLNDIKEEQGLTVDEQRWRLAAMLSTAIAILVSYIFQSPMPLVTAFMFCAFVVAQLEIED
jgi:hypothetical protein